MNFLQQKWLALPEKWRINIISALHTFIGVALSTLVVALTPVLNAWFNDSSLFDKGMVFSAISAALRAGVKAVWIMIVAQYGASKNQPLP